MGRLSAEEDMGEERENLNKIIINILTFLSVQCQV